MSLESYQRTIFYKWVGKQPALADKGMLSACAAFQGDTLLEAVSKFKGYYHSQRQCHYCQNVTSYIFGTYADGKTTWHCNECRNH